MTATARPVAVDPGVGDVVGLLDHGLTGRQSVADDDPSTPSGRPVTGKLSATKGRQGGLQVGPQDDRIAGHERGEGVGDGQRERVVPRRHQADDALGAVVLDRLESAAGGQLKRLLGRRWDSPARA